MAGIKSFSGISGSGLLGYNSNSDMTSLLGIDPAAMRKRALLDGLSRAGFALMGTKNYGDVGAAFVNGMQDSRGQYMNDAFNAYRMKVAQEDRDYSRSRDALGDKNNERDYQLRLKEYNRAKAWEDYQRGQQADADQRAADLRQGHHDAVTGWTQDYAKQGGTLPFSPEVRSMARQGGLLGTSSADNWRYNQMQPDLAAGDYDTAFNTMKAAPPEPKMTFGAPGSGIFQDGQYVGTVPKQRDPTTSQQDYEYFIGQLKQRGVPQDQWPTIQDYEIQQRRAGASTVNLDTQGNSYEKERGKSLSGFMDELEKGEKSAYDTLSSVQVMQNAMQDPNFYSGWGGNTVMQSKQFLSALGGDPNAAVSAETFNAESKRMALANMGGSLGTGFSNADRDFVDAQVANISNTAQGNQALLEINARIARRKIEIAQMARDYEIQNGRIDARFKQQLSKWALANPLFPESASMPKQQQPSSDPFGLRAPKGGQ